ncbi:MAG: hypothetical protein HC887_00890 [Desulfobacteraceae bacterium]|nr:hypothetical protein [Desulfobacteraceae bacterium]
MAKKEDRSAPEPREEKAVAKNREDEKDKSDVEASKLVAKHLAEKW